MAKILKQSTAAHIMFGPFVDKTDGVTLEVAAGIITSIDHATTGIFLSKNGAAGAIRHQAVTASVLDAYGMFQVHLDTTDTDTVGNLRVMMAEAATFLPVHDDYVVLPANVYDSLMGTDTLDVQVTGLAANVITEAAIADNAFANEHFAAGALTSAEITSAAGCVVASIANDAITAAAVDDDGAFTIGSLTSTGAITTGSIVNGGVFTADRCGDASLAESTPGQSLVRWLIISSPLCLLLTEQSLTPRLRMMSM